MASDVNSRRAARQKKARQRQLKLLLIFFIIIAIITLVVMCFTVFFKVEKVNVSGSKIYSKSQIIKASKLTTNDGLFFVSEDEIEQNIRKDCPYVDEVKLKRDFPDAIQLIVTDAKEYAYYNVGDKYYILSENGYILKQQDEVPENVFKIVTSGISGKPGEKSKYKNTAQEQTVNNLITCLQKSNINIDEIDVTSSLQIELKIEGKYTVLLGTKEYTEDKIKHLSSMLKAIDDDKDIIDLSIWTPENRRGSARKSNK